MGTERMKFDPKDPPRGFKVGAAGSITMKDCGSLYLKPDEQITLTTESGAEYDIARKDWGFYATPSLNGRLPQFGLRGVLIQNRQSGRYFVLLVERGREPAFDAYLVEENLRVVHWLDTDESCRDLDLRMTEP